MMGAYVLSVLAFYVVARYRLPLVPFMIFAMGAIGWMLATVEAMVAAPVVALGLLSPGGQSEVFGRAEPALMLVLNLFLRPALMVIGLMSATIVSVPVIQLVNTAFLTTVKSVMSNPGLVEQAIFISLYASFIVTVIGKCYSLIYIIPERILTWIGGQAVQYGEEAALQASKQAVEGAAGATAGAAKEGSGAASHAGAMAKRAHMGEAASIEASASANKGESLSGNVGGGEQSKKAAAANKAKKK